MTIKEYQAETIEKLEAIINQYPQKIPTKVAAEFIGCDAESLNAYLQSPVCQIGIAWRKPGKLNQAFCVSTRLFVAWAYKNLNVN